MLHHVFCGRGLGNVNSEFEQFAVEPRGSPQDIAGTHIANQLPDLSGNPGAANASRTTFPLPVEAESFSMPSDDRSRFDDREAMTPPGPEPGENDPQDPIGSPEPEPFPIGSLQDHKLMTKRKDFQLQGGFQRGKLCAILLTDRLEYHECQGGCHS